MSFARLDGVLLPPPWPAAVALLVVLGVFWLGSETARRLGDASEPRMLTLAAGFVVVTASVAALVQALSLLGVATPGVLRAVGGCLALASLGLLARPSRAAAAASLQSTYVLFTQATVLERWALVASSATVLGMSLAALGPPTDIDTLAYHLSVPLDWLAHGGARATPAWLHARLVGAGESLNLLGLAIGTDCLGAAFQAAGLLVAIAALTSVASTRAQRIFALALVTSCPVLSFLASSSKPQLLPAAATSVALALLVWHQRSSFERLHRGTLWMLFACVSFAVACKYSFIPAGVVLTLFVMSALRHTRWVPHAVLAGFSTFVVVALPVYGRNLAYYGDPLSPVLEKLRPTADPVVAMFSWYLRNFSGNHSLGHLVRLPWDLVVATSPGDLPNVLGVGALAMLAALGRTREAWKVLAAAATVTLITVVIGQLGARFLFEPYLWFGLAAVIAPWSLRQQWLFTVLCLQLAVTTPMAVYAAVTLFPGALTSVERDRTLTRRATDYALSKWLDEVLPQDAIVATDRRSSLFMPRPALHSDLAQMVDLAPIDDTERRTRLVEMLVRDKATTLVVTAPPESSPYRWLLPDLDTPVHTSPDYADAVRNPWREGEPYRVLIYDVTGLVNQHGRVR